MIGYKKGTFTAGMLLVCLCSLSQTTVIPLASSWKYWANTEANAPANAWKGGAAFDDSGWPSGTGRLGYGGDGETTCIPAGSACAAGCTPGAACAKYITTYFRKTINIPDINVFTQFTISLIRDDGAVVYVNGTEVWRSNMPGGNISYATVASTAVGGTDETTPFNSWTLPRSFFASGDNIIAVEIHQSGSTSSDLGFDLQLTGNNTAFTNEVVYLWSGAITPVSAKVNAKLSSPGTQTRLTVSTSPALSNPVYGPMVPVNSANNVVTSLSISGLTPGTKYYYAVESEGSLDASAGDVGSFSTPASGPVSFKFTVGACGLSSNHPVYTRMGDKDPLFNLITGDFHYANPNSATDIDVHRLPYENNMLSQVASRNLFLNYPLAYVWDDHDYSGNDSDSLAAGKTNARLAYREYVPHYPLGAGAEPDRPIYQAFTIGRIHFILTDLRSVRRTPTMMGTVQKQWFKDQCIFARDNDYIIAWISSVSYGGNQADNWGGYTAERTELGNFFRDNAIRNMFILSGDAHMVAIDNGTNHDFSTLGNNINDYPVMSAAALNQSGGYKGGTYSEAGTVIPPNGTNNSYINPNNTFGQYGVVEVTDAGGIQVCIQFTTYRVSNTGVEEVLVGYNFCRTMNAALPVKINSFRVQANELTRSALLTWSAEEEAGCSYTIERSHDGQYFIPLVTVPCRAGAGGLQEYRYEDLHTLPGKNLYRIRITEPGNRFSYSVVKSVEFKNGQSLKISPNPVSGEINLHVTGQPAGDIARYTILDAASKTLLQGSLVFPAGNSRHSIPLTSLPGRVYVIRIATKGSITSLRFMAR